MSGLSRSVRGDLGVNPPDTQPPRPQNGPPIDGPPPAGPPIDGPPPAGPPIDGPPPDGPPIDGPPPDGPPIDGPPIDGPPIDGPPPDGPPIDGPPIDGPPPDGPPGGGPPGGGPPDGPPGDDPPVPLPPPDHGEAIRRPLARLGLWGRLLHVLVFFIALWYFSLPWICPDASRIVAAAPPGSRAVPLGYRYDGGTAMFSDALTWLDYYQREATRAGPAASSIADRESGGIAGHTADLSSGILEMKKGFAHRETLVAQDLEALEARLHSARDEARYFEDTKQLWLCRLVCIACGPVTDTQPCPAHPVVIARREAEAVAEVLSSITYAHLELLKQHEDVQTGGLEPARDKVCLVSESFRADNPNRGGRGQHRLSGPSDLGSAAFGVCQLTDREMERGKQFRQKQLWDFMHRLSRVNARVRSVTSDLDRVHAGLSWSPEHIGEGIGAIDELLGLFGAR